MLAGCATPSCSSRPGTRRPRCPTLLEEARRDLPEVDLLVIDDGSTDDTAAVARAGGAQVVSFPENRGLRQGSPRATGRRRRAGTTSAAASTPTASTRRPSSSACSRWSAPTSATSRSARASCPDSGKDGERYKPAPERVVGTALLRLLMRLRLGQPISDGTSGMYAVNHKALDLLADPYVCEAPEVEALMRITDAGLRLRRGPGAHAPARARRVVVPRPPRGRAGRHDRPHAVRGRADARAITGASRSRASRGCCQRLTRPRAERERRDAGRRPAAADLARRRQRPQQRRRRRVVARVAQQVRGEAGERRPAVDRPAGHQAAGAGGDRPEQRCGCAAARPA